MEAETTSSTLSSYSNRAITTTTTPHPPTPAIHLHGLRCCAFGGEGSGSALFTGARKGQYFILTAHIGHLAA